MIQITKQEAKMIRKHMPHVHIKSTVHKAYAEESPQLMRFLRKGAYSKDVKRCA